LPLDVSTQTLRPRPYSGFPKAPPLRLPGVSIPAQR
jgi:hypothetical protein